MSRCQELIEAVVKRKLEWVHDDKPAPEEGDGKEPKPDAPLTCATADGTVVDDDDDDEEGPTPCTPLICVTAEKEDEEDKASQIE